MAITRKRLFRTVFCIILTLSIMASHMLAFPFVARANAAAVMTGGDLFTMILGVLGWAADSPSGQMELYGDSYGHMQAKIIKAEASGDEVECAALYRQACELGFYDLVPASAIESYKQYVLETTEHPDWLRWIETKTSEGTLVQTCVDALHKLSRDTMEFIDEWMDTLEIVTEAGKSAVNVVKSSTPSFTYLVNNFEFYDKLDTLNSVVDASAMNSITKTLGNKYILVFNVASTSADATRIEFIDLPESATSVIGPTMYYTDASGSYDVCNSGVAWYYAQTSGRYVFENYSNASTRNKKISAFKGSSAILKANGPYVVNGLAMAIVGVPVVDALGNVISLDYDLSNLDTDVKEKVPVTNIGTGAIDENIDDWLEGDEEEKETYLPSPLDWNNVKNPADVDKILQDTERDILDLELKDVITDEANPEVDPDEDEDDKKKQTPGGPFFLSIFKLIYFLVMIIVVLIQLFVKVFNFAFAVLSIPASPVFVNDGMQMGLNWIKTTEIVGFGISIWDFLMTLVTITLVFFIVRKLRQNIDDIRL